METSPKVIPAHLLLAQLRAELEEYASDWPFELVGHYGPCLRLPAQHPATGDLVLWVEEDEITLVIERITHCHFTCPAALRNAPLEEQARAIALETVDYVLDVLLDRILFEMEWHGDWIASVQNIPLAYGMPPQETLPEGVRRKRYLWSGPCEEVPGADQS